ncbi:MAG: hypothetical protein KAH14_02015 [Clostridiales bacterium]|nr:hypothetical protein [Clostridiales bacterium]
MKKAFAVIILIMSLLIGLLPGCSNGGNRGNKILRPFNISEDNRYKIKIYYPRVKDLTPKDETVSDWEYYVEKKYGLDIDLQYTLWNDGNTADESGWGIDIPDLMTKAESGGFVYINSYDNLQKLVETGLISPVNEYMNEVPWLAVLDDDIVKGYTDANREIWAFPLVDEKKVWLRKYNSDIMDDAGIDIPGNLDEFSDYAEYLRTIDPDGNGKKDTYISKFTYISFFYNFIDVFNAFGCYPDYSKGIGYNPLIGEFEVVMLSENFPQAMAYIKGLYDAGLIANTDIHDKNALKDECNVASVYGLYTEGNTFPSESYGLFLLGEHMEDLVQVTGDCSCLAVLNGTSYAGDKIQSLVISLDSNKESYMDFLYGEKDRKYINKGEYYSVIRKDNDGSLLLDEISIKINLDTLGLGDIRITSDENMELINRMSLLSDANKEILDKISELSDTNLTYSVPLDSHSNTLNDLNRNTRQDIRRLLASIMNNEISIESAVEECWQLIKDNGVSDKLRLLNDKPKKVE